MADLPSYNYPAGILIRIDGALYRPVPDSIPDRVHLMCVRTGQPFRCPNEQGFPELPTPDALDQLKIDGRLEEVFPESMLQARRLAAKTDWDRSDCTKLDPQSEKMLVQCELLDDHGVPNGAQAIQLAMPDLWTDQLREQFGEHSNPHTIKRWRSERGSAGQRTCKDMVRMNGKVPRSPWLDDVVEQIKQKHALNCHISAGAVVTHHALAAAEIKAINEGRHHHYPAPEKPYRCFSYDTFRRACIALEGSETLEAKHGHQYLQAKHKGAGKKLTATRILEKVIVDHTELDAFTIVDPDKQWLSQRAWLSVAIDVHSRACLAWVVTYIPPSYWTVYELLRRMLRPKRPPQRLVERFPILKRICGRPTELIVDNALEFRCKSMRDMAGSTGISVRFAPVKKPRYKAIGERALGTIPRLLLDGMAGRTLGVEYSRLAEYDPQAKAEITMIGLEALLNYAIAEYNIAHHCGLDDRQPALVFRNSANAHGIDMMCDLRAAHLEIMEVEENVQVTKSGARVFGLRYHCPRNVPALIDENIRFEPRRQARDTASITTKIKFDPSNIWKIHVWNRQRRTYLELQCEEESYSDGMPLSFHRELVERAAEEGRAFCSEEDRLEFRAIRIAALKNLTPKAKARERAALARLYEHPRIRQITKNLVSVDFDVAESVTADEFITHDVASLTSFDAEVLATTPPSRRHFANSKPRDRRSDAESNRASKDTKRLRPRRSRAAGGEYGA